MTERRPLYISDRRDHAWLRNKPSVVARGLVRPGVVRLKLIAPEDLRWDIAFIWREGAYLSRAAQAWLELLRERPVTGSVL